MYPSLFFTNSIQTNFNDYVYLKSYSNNNILVKDFMNSISLVLPSHLIESELRQVIDPQEIPNDEFDYYEHNLNSPREDNLYKGLVFSQKHFYRVIDNDLLTIPGKQVIEFIFVDYIDIKYTVNNINYRIQIGLPVKECRLNYYVNNQLSYPTFDLIIAEPNSSLLVNCLKPDYNTEQITIEINNNYKQLNQLSTEIIINNISPTELDISIVEGSNIVSRTNSGITITNIPRTNYVDNFINLEDLAWSIFSIKEYRPFDYISLLDGIVASLNNYIKDGIYLPPNTIQFNDLALVNRDSIVYSYYSNSLLLLALLDSYSSEITPVFSKYLENVIPKLTSAVNIYTGYANKELSVNLVPMVINDVSTSCLVTLVLEKYVSINYDSLIEYTLYIVNTQLDRIYSNNIFLDEIFEASSSIENTVDTLFHLFLWARSRNYNLDIITDRFTDLINNVDSFSNLDIKLLFKINYLSDNLNINTARSIEYDYQNFVLGINTENKLYGSLQANYPSLLISSLVNILTNNKQIWVSSTYRNRYLEVEVLLSNIFQKSLKYLPVNEPWFSLDSLDPNKGVIGLLLKSLTATLTSLFFEYVCYSTSLKLDNAYGIGLDRWGKLVGLRRQPNEIDSIYRSKIKYLLKVQSTSYEDINLFIENVRRNSNTKIISNLPNQCILEDELYNIESIEDLYSKASLNSPQGLYLPDGSFYELDKELGVLSVESYEDKDINNLILMLNRVYSIPVILKSSLTFTITSSDNVYK